MVDKKLIEFPCGCTYKTFDTCTCDETFCPAHQEEYDKRLAASVKARRRFDIDQSLRAIDSEYGPRAVREVLLELGKKGFGNKIETKENEAKALRQELAGL